MSKPSRLFGLKSSRWLLGAGIVLLGQAAVLRQLSVREVNVRVPELSQFPREFGPWEVSNEQTLTPDVLDFLRPDGYIMRDYVSPSRNASMNLFVAFFKSLQNTAGPHSPHDCLPGSGWLITSSSVPTYAVPGSSQGVPVNQYTMEKGDERILVVYWYQNDRHVWAEEFRAKLTLLPDLIRYRRSDVSLVRLITPLREGHLDQAVSSAQEFTKLTFPSLVRTFREAD
jgi:EpsI family protein